MDEIEENTPQLTSDNDDSRYMQAAIRYARRHAGQTGTNPAVGCLIVAGDGDQRCIIGRGVTAIGGRPHAEPIALAEAGQDAKGATAYVTLEPCAHHGVTPACAQTLINAGIARVVTAQGDPDTRTAALGHQMLRDAGIEVVEGVETKKAGWDLRGYLKRKSKSRPWVVLKLAITSDGYLGLEGAGQVLITGPITNSQTHMMRMLCDAILVGSGTALADDPSLNCRLPGMEDRSPIRIVLENTNTISADSNFIKLAAKTETYIACPQQNLKQRKQDLVGTGSKFIACDANDNAIALPELLADLSEKGISSLMVEGGKKVAEAFLAENLVDEIMLYVGREKMADQPAAQTNAAWISWPTLPDAIPQGFHVCDHWQYGTDKAIRMMRS